MTGKPPPACAGLEQALAATEAGLGGLHAALLRRDAAAIERQADELHRTLTQAVSTLLAAGRPGGVPPELRQRLAHANAQVASQREGLARASAALDRAMNSLLPPAGPVPALYSSTGLPRARSSSPGLDA